VNPASNGVKPGFEPGSAHPIPVSDLADRVRTWAEEEGSLPSRNKIMKRFRVGADKASDALALISGPTPKPTPDPDSDPSSEVGLHAPEPTVPAKAGPQVTPVTGSHNPGLSPGPSPGPNPHRHVPRWPLMLLALPAFVAIWSGWVGLGELAGFGPVHPLPGIAGNVVINTAITLPIGMETYAAYALWVWLSGRVESTRTRVYARVSALGSLGLGALGQVAYHLMVAAGMHAAPWQITTVVACVPVAVLGMGAALAHLLAHTGEETQHARRYRNASAPSR